MDGTRRVIEDWIAAFRRGDETTLNRVFLPDSVVHATEPPELAGDYVGLHAARDFVRRKAELAGGNFRWEAGPVVAGGEYAAVLFSLVADRESGPVQWSQIAVYRVEDDHIAEVWLFEDRTPRAR